MASAAAWVASYQPFGGSSLGRRDLPSDLGSGGFGTRCCFAVEGCVDVVVASGTSSAAAVDSGAAYAGQKEKLVVDQKSTLGKV